MAGFEVADPEVAADQISTAEEEPRQVQVVPVGRAQGSPRGAEEEAPVLAHKAAFAHLALEPAPHPVWEALLEEDEAQTLDQAEVPTFAERQVPALEPGPSTGFLLSDPVEPTWKPGKEFAKLEEVSEPVLRETHMERTRFQAWFPPGLVAEILSSRTRDLEMSSVRVSIGVENLTSMVLEEFC